MEKNKLIVFFIITLLALAIGFFVTSPDFDIRTVGVIILLCVFIPTLIKPDIGFFIIIISMLYSPDLILGQTSTREVTVRVEDIFLFLVILAWLIRITFTKDIFSVLNTKLTAPFFLYIAVCITSTILATMFSKIDISHAFLSILKYLEYFLLFLMVKDNLTNLKQLKIYVAVFILVALATSIYSSIFIQEQLAAGVTFFRVAPPVETTGGGEAGSMGGYLLFMMAICIALLFYMRSLPFRILLICLLLLMLRAFLYTLSRGSYIAFIPMLCALFYFSKKVVLFYMTLIVLVVLIFLAPPMVKDRVRQTLFMAESEYGSYLELEESPRERVKSWKVVLLERFPASPLFGYGVGRYFYDGQPLTLLSETGLLGLVLFIWVLSRLFRAARDSFVASLSINNDFMKGVSLGFLAGFVGLIAHSLSANTFIIIRIMEPFWFLAAMVISLPALIEKESVEQTQALI